jgi:hypothetical protein
MKSGLLQSRPFLALLPSLVLSLRVPLFPGHGSIPILLLVLILGKVWRELGLFLCHVWCFGCPWSFLGPEIDLFGFPTSLLIEFLQLR